MDLPLRIPAQLVQYSAFQSVFRTLPHYPALGRFPQRLPRSFGYSRPLARSLAPSTDFAEFTLPWTFIPVGFQHILRIAAHFIQFSAFPSALFISGFS